MTGYSNVFNNTDNLKTENLRLQNDLLSKYPDMINKYSAIQNDSFNNYENRFKTIEDQYDKNKILSRYILSQTYRPAIENNIDYERFEDVEDPNSIVHDDDNIDVAATGGSDNFKTYDNIIEPEPEPEAPIPVQEMEAIRPPEIENKTPIRNFLNKMISSKKKNKINPVEENNSFDDVIDSSNDNKYEYQYLPSDDGNNNNDLKLTEESLKKVNSPPQLSQNQKNIKKQKKVNSAKEEYVQAGGTDKDILKSRSLGLIREATILLQEKVKTKKKGKNKK